MIIIDMGSGNTCRNDFEYGKRMIDELMRVDSCKQEIIIKWQLFEKCGDNIPLNRGLFWKLYEYAWGVHGYKTTASVFDENSLNFLLRFEVPFIKIANNKACYPLIEKIPEGIPIIKSVGSPEDFNGDCTFLCCVSEYPADIKQYEKAFKKQHLKRGISDHTSDWTLYEKYKPELYECHYCLEDSQGLDAGHFARRPKQLAQIL
jgi:sialic acid synthase SpsE